MFIKNIRIVVILLAGWAGVAQAEASFEGEMVYLDLFEIITASRISLSPNDLPAAVTVLDREMIRASGFTEIHDLLRLVPGFQVADGAGSSPVVVNHGLGNRRAHRLLVMVDGRSLLNPLWGGVDWQELPLRVEDIERIEVVRGPNQATYGVEAFQGVVNIITRAPGNLQGGGATARYGDEGIRELTLRSGGEYRGIDWFLSASGRGADNFLDQINPIHPRMEVISRYQLNLQAAYAPNLLDKWNVHLGLVKGFDRVGSRIESTKDPYRDITSWNTFLQVGWRRFIAEGTELSVKYYHYGREEQNAYLEYPIDEAVAPVPFIPIDLGVEMARDDLQLQYNHSFSAELESAWGGGLRRDVVTSEHFLSGLGELVGYKWQLFGDLSWRLHPDWLLSVGGMVEKQPSAEVLFSPRAALNYTLNPNHVVRLSVGRGYRAPSTFEEYGQEAYPYSGGIANVDTWNHLDLDPEELRFLELGYRGQWEERGLHLDARAYIEKYHNYIDSETCVLDPETPSSANPVYSPEDDRMSFHGDPCPFSPPPGYWRPPGFDGSSWRNWSMVDGWDLRFGHFKASMFYNSDTLIVHGADLTLDWRSDRFGRFVISHAFTRINAQGRTDRDSEFSVPQNSTRGLWIRSWPGGIDTSIGYYKEGSYMWLGSGDDQLRYVRWDARVAKQFDLSGMEGEVALTVQNLNREHAEFRPEFWVERRMFVTLDLSW